MKMIRHEAIGEDIALWHKKISDLL